MMKNIRKEIEKVAYWYYRQLIYAFVSREKEAFAMKEGKSTSLPASIYDLDVGIKPKRPLTAEKNINI